MKGFPRIINSKQDVLYLKDEYPQRIKEYLQILVDTNMEWLKTGILEDGDAGITDSTHKVVEVHDEDDKDKVRHRRQYEFAENPKGPIFRMGFDSVKEVEDIIAELS